MIAPIVPGSIGDTRVLYIPRRFPLLFWYSVVEKHITQKADISCGRSQVYPLYSQPRFPHWPSPYPRLSSCCHPQGTQKLVGHAYWRYFQRRLRSGSLSGASTETATWKGIDSCGHALSVLLVFTFLSCITLQYAHHGCIRTPHRCTHLLAPAAHEQHFRVWLAETNRFQRVHLHRKLCVAGTKCLPSFSRCHEWCHPPSICCQHIAMARHLPCGVIGTWG